MEIKFLFVLSIHFLTFFNQCSCSSAIRLLEDLFDFYAKTIHLKKNIPSLEKKYSLLINEINASNPGDIEKNSFIEFISFCDGVKTSHSLQGYYAIGISTGTVSSKQMNW